MPPFRRVLVALLASLALAGSAFAEVLTLREPVDLRVTPGPKGRLALTAPVDSQLVILEDGDRWASVASAGRRYYASKTQLVAASPSDAPAPDPTCDYGYPYSGSGVFFARPLARLRHSEPFGFLLGYHRYYPC
jgi:hypothetical protein